jgi:hypothetical protein
MNYMFKPTSRFQMSVDFIHTTLSTRDNFLGSQKKMEPLLYFIFASFIIGLQTRDDASHLGIRTFQNCFTGCSVFF